MWNNCGGATGMTNEEEVSMNINIFQYSTPVHRPWRYSGQTINPGINWQSFMAKKYFSWQPLVLFSFIFLAVLFIGNP